MPLHWLQILDISSELHDLLVLAVTIWPFNLRVGIVNKERLTVPGSRGPPGAPSPADAVGPLGVRGKPSVAGPLGPPGSPGNRAGPGTAAGPSGKRGAPVTPLAPGSVGTLVTVRRPLGGRGPGRGR